MSSVDNWAFVVVRAVRPLESLVHYVRTIGASAVHYRFC